MIAKATGTAFRGNAEFEPLRWTGSSVYSESAIITGRPNTALHEMTARQLRASIDWRAAFSGAWRVEDITIARLDGEWKPPGVGVSEEPTTSPAKSPNGLASLLPRRFDLGQVTIRSANLTHSGIRLDDSHVTIRPDGAGWIFTGSGGQVLIPKLPAMDVKGFRVREQAGDFYLLEGNFRLGENGKISASGESSRGGRMEIAWEGIPSEKFLSRTWANRLAGLLSGEARITARDRATGKFSLRDGRIENTPLLGTVADFTGNPAFRNMPVQTMDGEFVWENGVLKISHFVGESSGLLRVEGGFTIDHAGNLSGNLQIGVTPQTLQWLPGSRKRVFTDSRGGYLWANLTLGGTLDAPTENLTPRLATAMGEEVLETGKQILQGSPDAAVEGVKGVINILRPLIP